MRRLLRRLKWPVSCCTAAIALLIPALLLSRPQERSLTKLARPLLAIKTQHGGAYDGMPAETAWWLNATRLLFVTTDQQPALGSCWRGRAEIYDLATQTRTRLDGLTRLFNQPNYRLLASPTGFVLSDSGRWLTYIQLKEDGNLTYTNALFNLATGEFRQCPLNMNGRGFWIDEKRFVEVTVKDGEPQYSVFDTVSHKVSSTLGASDRGLARRRFNQSCPMIKRADMTGQPTLKVSRMWLDDRTGTVDSENEQLPMFLEGEAWSDMSIDWDLQHVRTGQDDSPTEALLFHLANSTYPPIESVLMRFIPWIQADPITTEGLWINRRHAQGLEEIGHVPAIIKNGAMDYQLYQIQWLPDGRSVSFIYNGKLWIVPVATDK